MNGINKFGEIPSSNISSFSPLKEGENNQINKNGNEEKIAPIFYNNESIQSKILLPPFKKRRKRTNLDTTQKFSLDTFFRIDPRPDNARMVEIASLLDLDHDVVRVWFCNRRQKLRKN
ncbi:POU domain protein [Meloidogyne graminicola]|uniref:POU domain protein n=1 Tax=Meloidogyne graminicola TaxID=189291 RepID=A0A8S9ZLC7_9BILA|nr:POU domain protein [Meloidogyne graminicola]